MTDLHCWGCDYNLRGLAIEGRCPECGESIAESAEKRAFPVDRFSIVRFCMGVWVLFLAALVAFALDEALLFISKDVWRRRTGFPHYWTIHQYLPLVLSWIGIWLLTSPTARFHGRRKRPPLAWAARLSPLGLLAYEITWTNLSYVSPERLEWLYPWLASAAIVVTILVGEWFTFVSRSLRWRVLTWASRIWQVGMCGAISVEFATALYLPQFRRYFVIPIRGKLWGTSISLMGIVQNVLEILFWGLAVVLVTRYVQRFRKGQQSSRIPELAGEKASVE